MDHDESNRVMREPRQRSPQTTAAIKDLILTRGLRPGDPMPTESELVEHIGVSRSNVREAVRTLVALDILDVRHGTGTFVGQMSLRPLVEGLVFRGVLMPGDNFQALREVVDVRTELDLAQAPRIVEGLAGRPNPLLAGLVAEMARLSRAGRSFPDEDRAFHLGLAALTGNGLYGQLVAAFWDIYTTISPRLGLPTARDITDTADAHGTMLEAAVAGDVGAYRAAVHDHYGPLLRVLSMSGAAEAVSPSA